MTPFETDVLKIVIDKGLLALIALIAGFWLNRILEKFRAKNTYMQKLADAKLQAFGDVNEALFLLTMHVTKLRNLVTGDLPLPPNEEIRTKLLESGYKDMLTSGNEAQKSIYKHMVFLPQSLAPALLKCFDTQLELTELFAKKESPEFVTKFDEGAKHLLAQAASVHQQIVNEANRNPFDAKG